MKLTSLLVEQLDREAELTRRALQVVPEGHNDWKPHEKSMPLGQLAHMIATMPSWIAMMIKQDEHDIKPGNASGNGQSRTIDSTGELVSAHEKAVSDARAALSQATDSDLQTTWKLLAGGEVVREEPRYWFIIDNFAHVAHHRGQLTVYLRLNETNVPAIYGPSADDRRF